MCVEGLSDKMLISNGGPAIVVCITGRIEKPITEVVTRIPQVIDCMSAYVADPCLHAGILVAKDRGVTIGQVNIPGSNGGYVAPAGGGIVFWAQDIGDDIG